MNKNKSIASLLKRYIQFTQLFNNSIIYGQKCYTKTTDILDGRFVGALRGGLMARSEPARSHNVTTCLVYNKRMRDDNEFSPGLLSFFFIGVAEGRWAVGGWPTKERIEDKVKWC